MGRYGLTAGDVAGSDVLIVVEDTGPGIQDERWPGFSTRCFPRTAMDAVWDFRSLRGSSTATTAQIQRRVFAKSGTRFLISDLPHNMEVVSEPLACC